jgi:hypothetical protein
MIDEPTKSLLPKINPKLPKAIKVKAQLIFYKRLVQVTAWSLRYDYGLTVDEEGRSDNDDEHDNWAWEDFTFQVRYQVLMKLSNVGSFYRWQPYLQEFIFYNSVGYRQVPFGEAPNNSPGYSIDEGNDLVGKFINIKIYTQQSDANWRSIQRLANKKLRSYERKWEWNGADLELIAQVANLHRAKPKLSYSDIAGQVMSSQPKLANKRNGYSEDDIRKILKTAKSLGF